jgi:hypothetical protein
MSLESLAMKDFYSFVNRDNTEIELTDLENNVYTKKAKVNRIDSRMDPQTGTQIYEPVLAISLPLFEILPVRPRNGWKIKCTDTTGEVIHATVAEVRTDHTIGFTTMIGEIYDEIEEPEEEEV